MAALTSAMLFAAALFVMRSDGAGDALFTREAEISSAQPTFNMIVVVLTQVSLPARHTIDQVGLGVGHHLHQTLNRQLTLPNEMLFLIYNCLFNYKA
jgi:hypothetical protein